MRSKVNFLSDTHRVGLERGLEAQGAPWGGVRQHGLGCTSSTSPVRLPLLSLLATLSGLWGQPTLGCSRGTHTLASVPRVTHLPQEVTYLGGK